jgi:hypothetical protein
MESLGMLPTAEVKKRVIKAWAEVDAPPPEAMGGFQDEFGPDSAEAFIGKRPIDVDIRSFGFRNASPLLSLPPSAAGAYLGTYLISLFHELELQENSGLFSDLLTRAHTLAALQRPRFWERVIRGSLPRQCYDATVRAVRHIIDKKDFFRLGQEKIDFLEGMLSQPPSDYD